LHFQAMERNWLEYDSITWPSATSTVLDYVGFYCCSITSKQDVNDTRYGVCKEKIPKFLCRDKPDDTK
jgi:hypothetical protein